MTQDRTLTPSAVTVGGPPKHVGRLIFVLAALTAVAPLATDMYVPGFPDLARSLGTTDSSVQLSMTAFLVGLAVGQVLLGPISDATGRRRVLLAGAALFTVFSIACAVAPDVNVLNVARLLEGVAGAAGMVVSRAVLTDWFHGTPEAPRRFAALSAIVSVAPVAAPVIGGLILGVASWRVVFLVLAGFGVLLVVGVLVWVPESLPVSRRRSGGLASTFRAMAGLVGRRALVGYILASSFAGAGLFTYIAGSTFVFQEVYGVSPTQYSFVFAVNALGLLASSVLFGRLSARFRVNTLLVGGLAVATVATLVLLVLVVTTGGGFVVTWVCLLLTVTGLGIILPATMTIAQSLGHDAPGAASGLLGGVQFVLGAAASPLAGLFGTASPTPMVGIMLVSFALAALALGLLARPWQGHGEPARTATREP
ncbi:multidrug effflux MFS transporter [Streptosporangium carneum]|uniref:Bcr/CflA family drug resistance efflux transporter n=1 Tax=Streptosporangium carneum TaxID=47481 RepID=A0A9W6I6N9_9ACTN|nr:multidrug effflux MFS transporter [Streptosporangium carneum]GLK13065.1 Bcr/CflA family drug resistance efflux transporter [Streptosporangium carneum]